MFKNRVPKYNLFGEVVLHNCFPLPPCYIRLIGAIVELWKILSKGRCVSTTVVRLLHELSHTNQKFMFRLKKLIIGFFPGHILDKKENAADS